MQVLERRSSRRATACATCSSSASSASSPDSRWGWPWPPSAPNSGAAAKPRALMDSPLSLARRSLADRRARHRDDGRPRPRRRRLPVAPAPAFGLLALATACRRWRTWPDRAPRHPSDAGIALSIFSATGRHRLPGVDRADRLLIVAAACPFAPRAGGPRSGGRSSCDRFTGLALRDGLRHRVGTRRRTLYDKDSLLRLADRVGVVPFLLFAMAPAAFATARHRACCSPHWFRRPSISSRRSGNARPDAVRLPAIHLGRITGHSHRPGPRPFLEAVGNGTGIYIGLVAAVIAAATWKVPWQRNVAMVTAVLCARRCCSPSRARCGSVVRWPRPSPWWPIQRCGVGLSRRR